MGPQPDHRGVLPALGLFTVLVAVYAASLWGQWLNWDDNKLLADPILAAGVADALELAFTTTYDRAWYPVTRLVFWSLAQVDLLTPAVVHLLDLGLFLGSVGGLLLVLPRFGVPRAWVIPAVALWALHPHRVESVAWMSATKDVLSLGLGAAAALVMMPKEGRPTVAATAAGHLLWGLALLAKSAILPVAAVLWLAARVPLGSREATRRFGGFVALSLIDGLVARYAFDQGVVPAWPDGIAPALLAPYSFGVWAAGIATPTRLAAIYPILEPTAAWVGLGLLALLGPTGAAVLWARRAPEHAAAGWAMWGLWVLPVLPVAGAVRLAFWSADRYTLFISLAPAILLAAGLAALHQRRPRLAIPLGATLALLLAGLSARRALDWQSNLALWRADATRPGDHFARHLNLGSALGGEGRFEEALVSYRTAEALAPERIDVRAHRMFAELVVRGPYEGARRTAGAALEPPPSTARDWSIAAYTLLQADEPELAQEALSVAAALGAPSEVIRELEAQLLDASR